MMSIFSCACWAFTCPLWRTVYLDLLPIFQLDCLGFLLSSCVSWKLDYKSMKLIFICGLYDYYCFEVIYSVLMIFFSAWGAENSKIAYSGLTILVRTKSYLFCKQFFQAERKAGWQERDDRIPSECYDYTGCYVKLGNHVNWQEMMATE